jgi:predicted aldo/keto reductase-like oxidoreductase
LIDLFMFSLNPVYDFVEKDNHVTINAERRALYEEAQKRGAGITVMKPYGGSRLLSKMLSPYGRAMTPVQCIHYALERPAVMACLPGIRNLNDLKEALAYYSST